MKKQAKPQEHKKSNSVGNQSASAKVGDPGITSSTIDAPEKGTSASPKSTEAGSASDISSTSSQKRKRPSRTSVYMHGSVGTGKTMLLDLVYNEALQSELRVVRKHFYEFMLGLHKQIHEIAEEGPVEIAANTLADNADVLCFDEFQITDIQDAVILPRLFEVLFLRGVIVIMTSNTAPQLLYSGGLNRHVHLPAFVSLLGDYCIVLGLGGGSTKRVTDYRRRMEAAEFIGDAASVGGSATDTYLCGVDFEQQMQARWLELAGNKAPLPQSLSLAMGRTLHVPQAAGNVCWMEFGMLCGSDRGEADFFALAEHFDTVFLNRVPRFASLEDADLVRRFVKLLDVLYDRRVRLVVGAAAVIDELFTGMRAEVLKGDMTDLAWRTALYSADGKVGMAPSAVGTLCEAIRATERAESRLREMRTLRYWNGCKSYSSESVAKTL